MATDTNPRVSDVERRSNDPGDGGGSSRRDFLQLAGALSAGAVTSSYTAELASAFERAGEGDLEVVWLQGQACTGCTVSMLQARYPTLEEVLSEFRLDVTFHPTIMPEGGGEAMAAMSDDPDLLIVEGAVPTGLPEAATVGGKPVVDWVLGLAGEAEYVVAVGNCASFGGWPAAENRERRYGLGENVTGARGLQFERREAGGVLGPDFESGAGLPVINLGGCPPNADYILLTLATLLNGHEPELDEYGRPEPFYGPRVHDGCPLRGYFDSGDFADKPGDEGCLVKTGCAGPYTHCDDVERLWNDGTSVCLNVGAPCMGCTEPGFWDRFSPFRQEVEESAIFGTLSAEDAGVAALVVAGAGIAAHFARRLSGYGKFEQETDGDGADDARGGSDPAGRAQSGDGSGTGDRPAERGANGGQED